MPPLHPMIVHFPIALAIMALVSDVVGDILKRPGLYLVGHWSMVGAALAAGLAVLAGYLDMNRASLSPELDGYVHLHMRIGWVILAVLVLLAGWRLLPRLSMTTLHHVIYRLASTVGAALVVFQGWYGGEMVYVYGTSVAAVDQGVEAPEIARNRLRTVYDWFGAPHGRGHGRK